MENKITKTRLKAMLSYDWIKMVAIIVATVLVWSLIYSLCAPKLTLGERMQILIYTSKYSDAKTATFDHYLKNNVTSDFIFETQTSFYSDDITGGIAMSTILASREGDILITSNKLEDGDEKSNFERYLGQGYFYNIDDFIDEAIAYASERLSDENLMEQKLRARIKKHKSFKTEKQIKKALVAERARLENILEKATLIKTFLSSNEDVKLQTDKAPNAESGTYAIKIDKLPSENKTSLSKMVQNSDGTVDDLVISIFNFKGKNGDLFYDTVYVLYELINYITT